MGPRIRNLLATIGLQHVDGVRIQQEPNTKVFLFESSDLIMLTLLTSSIILAVAYLAIVATLAIVAALRFGGRREDASEEHDALRSRASRFRSASSCRSRKA